MEEFKSEIELYNRLLPALKTRSNEFRRSENSFIKKEDIWNYLKETKWKNAKGLSLYEMVSDILSLDYLNVEYYLKDKLKYQTRDIILESE